MVKIVVTSRQKFKELGEFVETQSKKETREQKKACRAKAKQENRPFKEVWAEFEAEQKRLAEEKASLEAEEKARLEAEQKLLNPSQEELLKEIRDLLKESNKKSK